MAPSNRKTPQDRSQADASQPQPQPQAAPPTMMPQSRPVSPPVKADTMLNGGEKVPTEPQSMVHVPLPFTTLGRYQVVKELGRGGMGAVYLAEDTVLKRKVALKIPQFEPSKAEQMQARFLREAQMAAQLSHPNICQTYDVGVIDGQYVMAMEYIEGKTLAAYAKPDKLLGDRQVVTLVRKVALAVEAAHLKGMIHRDLKPGNIMLCRPDPTRKTIEPKVMDFGLAKSLAGSGTELTKTGMIVGTACYMSKEQWSGKEGKLGATCDVFSLGVILYELLTGQLPYDVEDGEPPTSWLVKLMTEPQRRLSEHVPNIDAALERIVMKAIAIEPENRYGSMAEFAAALDDWSKGKPTSAGIAEQTITELPFNFSEVASVPSAVLAKPRSRRKPPAAIPLWFKLAGGAAALLLVISVIIWFRSGDAMVKVEVFSDDVEVTFQNETIELADGAHDYRVTPGDHVLHIKSGNAEFDTDRFTLKKGQNSTVTVQIVEDEVVAKSGAEVVGRRQILASEKLSTQPSADSALSDVITNSIGMKLKLIPAGEFMMGSPAGEAHRGEDEGPQHKVRITKAFYLCVTEVTKGQWFAVMKTKPWERNDYLKEGNDYPVTYVSWDDAVTYCSKLSALEGKTYRLPTEAEWEYACRGGQSTAYSFGSDYGQLPTYGWVSENSTGGPSSVAGKESNPFGLYDMHGNVWEWCSDLRGDYSATAATDPMGPPTGSYRVLRGGSWRDSPNCCRSAYRFYYDPSFRDSNLGFRLALSPSGH